MIHEKGLTLLGVSLSGLDGDDTLQLELPLGEREEERRDTSRLDSALDAVRDRFGTASVGRANQLGRDQGVSVPVLPEHE